MVEYWYRVYETRYAPSLDEFENPIGEGEVKVTIEPFQVIRKTPCGVWIAPPWAFADENGHYKCQRWVKRDANKRFACPTIVEAVESFKARKVRQIKILNAQIRSAERAIMDWDRNGEKLIEKLKKGEYTA